MTITKEEIEQARRNSELKYELDLQSKVIDAKREAIRDGKKDIIEQLKMGRPLEGILLSYQIDSYNGEIQAKIDQGIREGRLEGKMEIINMLKSGKPRVEIVLEWLAENKESLSDFLKENGD